MRPAGWFGGMVAACLMGLTFVPMAFAHNVYSSFTEIEWNADDNSIEVIVQLHSHELETKLSLLLDQRLSFLDENDLPTLEQATGAYLINNLMLNLDGQAVDLIFLGLETDGQNVIAYLEQDWPGEPKALEFYSRVFLDDLPGQVNSVLATVSGVRQGGDININSGPVSFIF